MADVNNIPQLLTIDQLAERLGVTQRYIRRLVAERRVPYRMQLAPYRNRFRRSSSR